MITKKGHYLGAFASKPNANYLGFPSHLVRQTQEFPVRAFVTGKLGPTKNQGQQGSCTGHGSTSQGERLYRRYKGESPIFSPAFHYYIERQIEGTLGHGDTGAQVSTSLEVAQNGGHGFCPLEDMPYSDADLSTPPSAAALAAALKNPGGSWHSIGNDISNIKACIMSDYTGVIGISIYDSFEDDAVQATGLVPLPNIGVEQLQGGHEVHALIGFDDDVRCPNAKPGAVMLQNSWGPEWGIAPPETSLSEQRGFAWLPYEFLMSPMLTSDVRMQHLGKSW